MSSHKALTKSEVHGQAHQKVVIKLECGFKKTKTNHELSKCMIYICSIKKSKTFSHAFIFQVDHRDVLSQMHHGWRGGECTSDKTPL
jgi:hypothetical protein